MEFFAFMVNLIFPTKHKVEISQNDNIYIVGLISLYL